MKTVNLKQELLLLVLASLPSLFMLYNWELIPATIALHYGFDGQPDRWGGKEVMALMIPTVSVLSWFIFFLIPFIDPRKRIQSMGNKYFSIRLLFNCIVAAVLWLFIFSTYNEAISFTDSLYPLLAVSIIVIGNYLQSVKPNYFIGIRTPWALHSDRNWVRTHRFGGRWYIFSGMLLLISWYVFRQSIASFYFPLMLIQLFVPVIFSFIVYKTDNK